MAGCDGMIAGEREERLGLPGDSLDCSRIENGHASGDGDGGDDPQNGQYHQLLDSRAAFGSNGACVFLRC